MISVIIPAFNEEKEIGRCLESIIKQTAEEPLEIIVVNNGSTDNTARVVREFLSLAPIILLDEPRKGRGAARATGFAAAKGDILFSTDADTACPPNWAAEMIKPLRTGRGVAVCGTSKITDNSWLSNLIFNWLQPFTSRLIRLLLGHHWLCGFSFAITADAYKKSGGIRPDLNAMEDVELSFRVSRLGKIVFLSNIPVDFSGRRFRGGWLKGMLSYIKPFMLCWLGRKKIYLSDVR